MKGENALRRRGQVWNRIVRPPARFAGASAVLLGLVLLALLSRQGTDVARHWALGLGAVGVVCGVVWTWLGRRWANDPLRIARQLLVRVDEPLGLAAARAACLAAQTTASPARSPEEEARVVLAQLHLQRSVERVSEAGLRRLAEAHGRRYRAVGAVLALLFLMANLLWSRQVAEGLNLMATSGSTAPLPMHWIERLAITARPPAYLRQPERRVLSGGKTWLPEGTELVLRAKPLLADRKLVVTDGREESELVSDGAGGLVAHFTVMQDSQLRVAARFGQRLIVEPRSTEIVAQPDRAPVVVLEGAPRSQSLAELTRLPLRWAVDDDHGLRQVELVLRTGFRTERRSLAQFEGDTTSHRGGTILQADDEFLKSLFLPTEIRVEASDNYPFGDQPQWGRSEPIVVVPTAVGEPEALRYRALTQARDRFVALLSESEPQISRAEDYRAAVVALQEALGGSFAGLDVPPGLVNFVKGRVSWVQQRVDRGAPEQFERALENLVLSFDDALAQLARHDAEGVSKRLALVADEAEARARWISAPETPSSGEEQLAQALFALKAGSQQLLGLGRLGQDLGSVAEASLGRLDNAEAARDWFHVALAAHHLAERLRRPTPSFGSKGGDSSGGGGGGQGEGQSGSSSGGAGSEPGQEGSNPGDRAEGMQSFDELARQISELARQHAEAIEEVTTIVSQASGRPGEGQGSDEMAGQLAEQLQRAVSRLPLPGHLPGTPQAMASLAREHSQAMAHALESSDFEQALISGRSARAAFEQSMAATSPFGAMHQGLADARPALEEALRWVTQRVAVSRQKQQKELSAQLSDKAAVEEQLAGITDELAQRGQTEAAAMPPEVVARLRQARTLMEGASRLLAQGQGRQGLEKQRTAQSLLERADRGQASPRGESAEGGQNASSGGAKPDSVPDELTEDPALEFRRRVLENLGQSEGGQLAPAVQRYAEGLLN